MIKEKYFLIIYIDKIRKYLVIILIMLNLVNVMKDKNNR